jgi:hypothetical protein
MKKSRFTDAQIMAVLKRGENGMLVAHRTCGFGVCFLYLRNVKSFEWNHKRLYRIYRALELYLQREGRLACGDDRTPSESAAEPRPAQGLDGAAARHCRYVRLA